MIIEWDPSKSDACYERRGFGFTKIYAFDFGTAVVTEDDRYDYGEVRYRAFNYIDAELFSVVFTVRDNAIRVISLRRAHEKEAKRAGLPPGV